MHPGPGNAPSWAIDPDGRRVRTTGHAFLTSPEARELLRREGIVVIDYRGVQRKWSEAAMS
ncbi:hypothetical protein ABT126_14495 [Streptomyces sp. NPDC002012]|uniref:hypothetical protein n=1 Tax=unclassified Streptomyces TaxID=2593676 RepID=UPI002E150E45|nr:hypothetical protein OG609_38270 [Streptomyces sp. NBC_01224]